MSNNNIQWPDKEYKKLEKGVCDLVKSLHLLGIKTIFSCQGHIRTSSIYTGILPWPNVILLITEDEITILQEKLDTWNNLNPEQVWILSKRRIHGSYTPEYIRSCILPRHPGHTVTTLCPRSENHRLDDVLLGEMQIQANELSEFLRQK